MEGGHGKKVVVVGGGLAGSLIAKTLQFTADVTLIDPKDYFEITWARLRGMVEPSFAEKSVMYHKDYLTNGQIVTSRATNITESEVLTADGRQVPYNYLVVATGVADPLPESRTERLNQFESDNEKIKSAQSILIVGGGPTGVELAAEIAFDYPEKKVTLVHSGSRLLEFIGPKASSKALNWLKRNRVEVKLDQKVDLDGVEEGSNGKTYRTSAGETIEADLRFDCIGKPLGSAWIKNTILHNNLDSQGRLMVDVYLRVKNRTNIFALGDITDVPELKQGYLAKEHALLTAKNITLLMKGGKETKMGSYKPGKPIAVVSLGRRTAVAQFPFMTISGRVPGMIKSKNLFVGKSRQDLGLEP